MNLQLHFFVASRCTVFTCVESETLSYVICHAITYIDRRKQCLQVFKLKYIAMVIQNMKSEIWLSVISLEHKVYRDWDFLSSIPFNMDSQVWFVFSSLDVMFTCVPCDEIHLLVFINAITSLFCPCLRMIFVWLTTH